MKAQIARPSPPAAVNGRSNYRSAPDLPPETWVNPRDGSVMRLIPAGEFIMGSTTEEIESARQMDQDGPLFTLRHESPQCEVSVPAFYLGVFTITNCQFARFLTDVCPTPGQLELWLPVREHILNPPDSNEPFRVERNFELHPACAVVGFQTPPRISSSRMVLIENKMRRAVVVVNGCFIVFRDDAGHASYWAVILITWVTGTNAACTAATSVACSFSASPTT